MNDELRCVHCGDCLAASLELCKVRQDTLKAVGERLERHSRLPCDATGIVPVDLPTGFIEALCEGRMP